MESKQIRKGLFGDEVKWFIEILMIVAIFLVLLKFSGVSVTVILNYVGTTAYTILSTLIIGIGQAISNLIRSILSGIFGFA